MLRPLALLLVLLLGAILPAQDAYAETKLAFVEKALPGLEKLAAKARKALCFGECLRTWEAVVALSPDHEIGRERLRYEPVEGGGWVRHEEYRIPKDFDGEEAERIAKARDQALAPVVASWHELLSSPEGTALAAEHRKAEVRALLRLAPDDARARGLLDIFVPRERADLLEEASGGRHRKGLKTLAQHLMDTVDVRDELPLTPVEEKIGVRFAGRYEAEGVRIFATAGRAEAERIARSVAAAIILFRRITGSDASLPEGFTIYLMSSDHARDIFIEDHPKLGKARKASLRGMVTTWLGNAEGMADWSASPERRRDGSVRGVLALLLATEYGLTVDHSWIWEGLGLHLTEVVCGTRLTWFVKMGDYGAQADPLRERLMQPGVDWGVVAAEKLVSEGFPSYRDTLSYTLENFSDRHLLAGWALAAWLIEVHPEVLEQILRGLKEPADTPKMVEGVLGFPLDELPERIARWLPHRD